MTLLKTAKELFIDTLYRLRIADVIRTRVRHQSERLHIGELAYDLQDYDRVVVIAIGKAATPMWETLLPALEPALKQKQTIEAVVVGTTNPQKKDPGVQFFPGSHPLPNQTSIDAAEAVLKLLGFSDNRSLVLFLISGGASAMMEKALERSVTVEETAQFYRALVHSGLPIAQMNALRKHFSQVKGGRRSCCAECNAVQSPCLRRSCDYAAYRRFRPFPSRPVHRG